MKDDSIMFDDWKIEGDEAIILFDNNEVGRVELNGLIEGYLEDSDRFVDATA